MFYSRSTELSRDAERTASAPAGAGLGQRLCCVVRTTPPPSDTGVEPRHRPRPSVLVLTSAFAGFRFPPEVITLAVRWYLRFGLSYRDVEELLAERGVRVDHVSVYRWVQRFTPIFAEAARPIVTPSGSGGWWTRPT